MHKLYGPVALVHIDAHLDTWDTYFGAPHTHGTPFRRAAEEGLFASDSSVHIGIRGPLYSQLDLANDAALGFCVIHCDEFTTKARLRGRSVFCGPHSCALFSTAHATWRTGRG